MEKAIVPALGVLSIIFLPEFLCQKRYFSLKNSGEDPEAMAFA